MQPPQADPLNQPGHLARFEPLPRGESGRVLTLGWKLLLNASLLLIPALLASLLVPTLALLAWFGSDEMLLISAILIPMIFAIQIAWAGTYPEWPLNRLLTWRLRRSCLSRSTCLLNPGQRESWIRSARMVEWVPQEHWNTTRLDTARDVMLIEVTESGVIMEGDKARYYLPPDSILDSQFVSIRPTGCFHRLHFVILTVRTADGPIEFPIAYRDYGFGNLSSRRRREQTEQLCRQIGEIATGSESSFSDPDYEHRLRADQRHPSTSGGRRPRESVANPYAAPKLV